MAGDSNARRIVSNVCRERGIDLDDPAACEALEKIEAAELESWEVVDRLRRLLESRP
jgi:hypothetical protein